MGRWEYGLTAYSRISFYLPFLFIRVSTGSAAMAWPYLWSSEAGRIPEYACLTEDIFIPSTDRLSSLSFPVSLHRLLY
jgi:hypothetical protein